MHVWPLDASGGACHPCPVAHLADAQLAQELARLPGKGLIAGGAITAALHGSTCGPVNAVGWQPAGGGGWGRQAAIAPNVRSPAPVRLQKHQGRPARRHAQGRGGARDHLCATPAPRLTSLGATTDDRVMRFSAAPGLPALTTSVSPEGTSLITALHQPVVI